MRRIVMALVGAAALSLTGLVSAGATTPTTGDAVITTGDHGDQKPELKIKAWAKCGVAYLKFENPTDWAFLGDYAIDGSAPLSSDENGDLWNTVLVDGRVGEHEKVVEIPLDEDSGTHAIQYRWARGAESDLYDPEQWWTLEVNDTDCSAPDPALSYATCDDPTASLNIPASDKWTYTLKLEGDVEGQPIEAGDHDIATGNYVVEAWNGEKPQGTWLIEVEAAPSEDECNPPTEPPVEPPVDEPNNCDAYADSDAWCNPDTDDYNCPDVPDANRPVELVDPENDPFNLDADGDGTGCEVEPTTEPTDDPTEAPLPGDDDGTDQGTLPDTGDDLPDTGSNAFGLGLGAAGFVLLGLLAMVYRRRASLR